MTNRELTNLLREKIPLDVEIIIYRCNLPKDNYDKVMKELTLSYNQGLWWLYRPQPTESYYYNAEGEYIFDDDQPNKVEFQCYDEDNLICEQAILHEELLNELKNQHVPISHFNIDLDYQNFVQFSMPLSQLFVDKETVRAALGRLSVAVQWPRLRTFKQTEKARHTVMSGATLLRIVSFLVASPQNL